MFFTGIFMMLFYLIQVKSFASLLDIFLIVALLLAGVMGYDRVRAQLIRRGPVKTP